MGGKEERKEERKRKKEKNNMFYTRASFKGKMSYFTIGCHSLHYLPGAAIGNGELAEAVFVGTRVRQAAFLKGGKKVLDPLEDGNGVFSASVEPGKNRAGQTPNLPTTEKEEIKVCLQLLCATPVCESRNGNRTLLSAHSRALGDLSEPLQKLRNWVFLKGFPPPFEKLLPIFKRHLEVARRNTPAGGMDSSPTTVLRALRLSFTTFCTTAAIFPSAARGRKAREGACAECPFALTPATVLHETFRSGSKTAHAYWPQPVPTLQERGNYTHALPAVGDGRLKGRAGAKEAVYKNSIHLCCACGTSAIEGA
ncbi:hypothetical protein E2320_013840, partial [Naja naja]